MLIHVLHPWMITLRYPLLPQATTRGSTIYKPQLIDIRAGLSCYKPPFVMSGGVPNTKHNLYSQHKISNINGHNLWLLNQVETICTSHNSHTHTGTNSPSHNLGSPRVHPLFRPKTQGILQQGPYKRYHPKLCRPHTMQRKQTLAPVLSASVS